jgi:hypothetical protein
VKSNFPCDTDTRSEVAPVLPAHLPEVKRRPSISITDKGLTRDHWFLQADLANAVLWNTDENKIGSQELWLRHFYRTTYIVEGVAII